jgi:hypothetical protein
MAMMANTGTRQKAKAHPLEVAGFDKVILLMIYGETPVGEKALGTIFLGLLRPEQEPVFAIFRSLFASMVCNRGVVNETRIAILIPPAASYQSSGESF